MRKQRFGGLWQNPDFMKLWTGQIISQFGSRISRDGLPYVAVLVLAATPFEMGLLAALASAPVLVMGLFAGVWVDRLHRRPIMIFADLSRAILVGSIPVAALLNALTMTHLLIVAALAGVFTVFFNVADQSYLPTIVSRENVLEGNSKLGASDSVAEIAGPSLAGVLVQTLSAPLAIIFDAVSFLISAFCLGLIRKKEPPVVPDLENQNIWREIREGLAVVWQHPILRPLAISAAIQNFFGGFFDALYLLFALKELKVDTGILGIIIGMGGVGALLGALVAGSTVRRFGLGKTLVGTLIIGVAFSVYFPFLGGPMWLIVVYMIATQVVGDAVMTIFMINEVSLRQTVIPERLLGRANASMHFLVGAVFPFAPLIAGLLAELIGMRLTLLIAIIGMAFAGLMVYLSPVRRLTSFPTAPETEKAE